MVSTVYCNFAVTGFGYRAKFIVETARIIKEAGGTEWVTNLRTQDRDAVREQLLTLSGVGPKVVCFS